VQEVCDGVFGSDDGIGGRADVAQRASYVLHCFDSPRSARRLACGHKVGRPGPFSCLALFEVKPESGRRRKARPEGGACANGLDKTHQHALRNSLKASFAQLKMCLHPTSDSPTHMPIEKKVEDKANRVVLLVPPPQQFLALPTKALLVVSLL